MSNRVIKFRAWDKSSNRMVSFEELCNGDHDSWPDLYFALVPYNDNLLDRLVPLQFTGLLDKNGKEIYEKDWVSDENGSMGVIEYFEKDMSFKIATEKYENEGGWGNPLYGFDGNTLEVIGNIYEGKTR